MEQEALDLSRYPTLEAAFDLRGMKRPSSPSPVRYFPTVDESEPMSALVSRHFRMYNYLVCHRAAGYYPDYQELSLTRFPRADGELLDPSDASISISEARAGLVAKLEEIELPLPDPNKPLMFVSYDIPVAGGLRKHRFMAISGPAELCALVCNTPPCYRGYDEILQTHEPCKMHLDVDVDIDSDEQLVRNMDGGPMPSEQEIRFTVDILCRLCLRVFNRYLKTEDGSDVNLADDDFLVLPSHRPFGSASKISFHVIIGCELGFRDRITLRQAAAIFVSHALLVVSGDADAVALSGLSNAQLARLRQNFHFRKYKRGLNSEEQNPGLWENFKLGCLLDTVIYSTGKREFRLPGCFKLKELAVQGHLPVDRDAYNTQQDSTRGLKLRNHVRYLHSRSRRDLARPWHHGVVHYFDELFERPVFGCPDETASTAAFDHISKLCQDVKNNRGLCAFRFTTIVVQMNKRVLHLQSRGRVNHDQNRNVIWESLLHLQSEHSGRGDGSFLGDCIFASAVRDTFAVHNSSNQLYEFLRVQLGRMIKTLGASVPGRRRGRVSADKLVIELQARLTDQRTGRRFCMFCPDSNGENTHSVKLSTSLEFRYYCFGCGQSLVMNFLDEATAFPMVPFQDDSSLFTPELLEGEEVRIPKLIDTTVPVGLKAFETFRNFQKRYEASPDAPYVYHDCGDMNSIFGSCIKEGCACTPQTQPGTIILWSSMGTGKTELISSLLQAEPEARVMSITFRRILSSALSKRLGLVNYRENGQYNPEVKSAKRISVQLDSLHSLFRHEESHLDDAEIVATMRGNKRPDILILDEFTSLLTHLNSSTLANHVETANYILGEITRNARTVIFADADMDETTVKWILAVRPMENLHYFRIHINRLSPHHRFYCFMPFMSQWFDRAESILEEEGDPKNIFIVCPGKSHCRALELHFHKFLSFSEANSDRPRKVKAVTGDDTESTKELMSDTVNWSEYRVLIINSVIGAGVDYVGPHFAETFAFIGTTDVNPRDVSQLLARVRAPLSGRLNVYLHAPRSLQIKNQLENVSLASVSTTSNIDNFGPGSANVPPPVLLQTGEYTSHYRLLLAFIEQRAQYQKNLAKHDYFRAFIVQILGNFLDPSMARVIVNTKVDNIFGEIRRCADFVKTERLVSKQPEGEVRGFMEMDHTNRVYNPGSSRGERVLGEIREHFLPLLGNAMLGEEIARHLRAAGGLVRVQNLLSYMFASEAFLEHEALNNNLPLVPTELLDFDEEATGDNLFADRSWRTFLRRRRALAGYLVALGSPPEVFNHTTSVFRPELIVVRKRALDPIRAKSELNVLASSYGMSAEEFVNDPEYHPEYIKVVNIVLQKTLGLPLGQREESGNARVDGPSLRVALKLAASHWFYRQQHSMLANRPLWMPGAEDALRAYIERDVKLQPFIQYEGDAEELLIDLRELRVMCERDGCDRSYFKNEFPSRIEKVVTKRVDVWHSLVEDIFFDEVDSVVHGFSFAERQLSVMRVYADKMVDKLNEVSMRFRGDDLENDDDSHSP